MKSTRLSIMKDVIVRSPEAVRPTRRRGIAMEVLIAVVKQMKFIVFLRVVVTVLDIVACAEPTLLADRQMSMHVFFANGMNLITL